jgi:WD40 repeat protein
MVIRRYIRNSTEPVYEPVLWFDAPAVDGGIALSADGSRLAVGGKQLVRVFSVTSGATLRKLPQSGRTRCVALSTDGRLLLIGGFDKCVSLRRCGSA